VDLIAALQAEIAAYESAAKIQYQLDQEETPAQRP